LPLLNLLQTKASFIPSFLVKSYLTSSSRHHVDSYHRQCHFFFFFLATSQWIRYGELSVSACANTAHHQTLVTASAIPNAIAQDDFYANYIIGDGPIISGNYHGHEFKLKGTANVRNFLTTFKSTPLVVGTPL
jgi:hypothetical protein